MNTLSKVAAYASRNVSIIIFALSLLFLAASLYVVFQPHISHRIFAALNTKTDNDTLFYDANATPAPMVQPSVGGCGCPSCCPVPAGS
jgi:hypothetical protein